MALTSGQKKAVAIIPHFTGSLSFFGSSYITYAVLSDRTKWSKTYYRILLSMSIFDVFTSVAMGLSTWPIPASDAVYDSFPYGAKGNTGTCTAQGFFVQASMVSPYYNGVLALYYLLLVRYAVPQQKLRERFEPWAHGVTLAFGLGFAFTGLGLDLYNNAALWCWIAPHPPGCQQSFNAASGQSVTCERGDNSDIYRWAFFFGPLWLVIFSVMIMMWMMYKFVRKQERKAAKWKFKSAAGHGGWRSAEERQRAKAARKESRKSRLVATQALRYVAVFYVTWLGGSINRLIQATRNENVFFLMVVHAIFAPMQGFLNFLVYVQPKYSAYRKKIIKERKRKALAQQPLTKPTVALNSEITSVADEGVSHGNFHPALVVSPSEFEEQKGEEAQYCSSGITKGEQKEEKLCVEKSVSPSDHLNGDDNYVDESKVMSVYSDDDDEEDDDLFDDFDVAALRDSIGFISEADIMSSDIPNISKRLSMIRQKSQLGSLMVKPFVQSLAPVKEGAGDGEDTHKGRFGAGEGRE